MARFGKLQLNMNRWLLSLLAALAWTHCHAIEGRSIAGAGSSAAAPIYRSWASEYAKESGVVLTYEAIGSSAGLKKIRASETGFGASDVAPSAAELMRDGLVLFPIAITGISPVIHLPKIGDTPLRLSGDALARIFLGEIKRWNDPEIMRLNPGVTLPGLQIKRVVRSDGSGTTYNFADYLSKVNPVWKQKYGVNTHFSWPADCIAVKGSDGVVKAVQDTVGAIGYVDFGYVQDNKLQAVQMKNSEGHFVAPSTAAFKAALNSSDWVRNGEFTTTLTDKTGANAWPITMGTFALVPRVASQPEKTQAALQFFIWALMNGDALVQKSNFVRLPDRVQALAFRAMMSVRDKAGRALPLSLMRGAADARQTGNAVRN